MTETLAPTAAHPLPKKRPRDIRLDFFRGLCLFIIFIAHTYGNPWAQFIPARFGFSDATEIFVFCSGMASAIAFGAVFDRHGLLIGFGRVTFRIWQVYWAHISVFVVAIALTIVTDDLLGGTGDYLRGLQFDNLFNENAASALLGIVTLSWVPAYFDILPMYLVLLCMMPFVILAVRVSFWGTAALLVAIWFGAQIDLLEMPSVGWSAGSWFFNPFGWQLIFFTGFALMRGWIPAPGYDPRLLAAAFAYVVLTFPLEWQPLLLAFDSLTQARTVILPLIDKGELGIMRYVHFLALAYIAVVAVGEAGRRLKGPVVKVVAKVGQQSLGVFMSGLILSFIAGPFLNAVGRTYFTVLVANVGSIAAMIAIAYTVAWYKRAPWSRPPAAATVMTPADGTAPVTGEPPAGARA